MKYKLSPAQCAGIQDIAWECFFNELLVELGWSNFHCQYRYCWSENSEYGWITRCRRWIR